MTKKTILMTMLMACAIGGAEAQQLTTKGTLQDATSGEALPFTNCVLLRQQDSTFVQGTTTDASGLFRFSPVDTGSYLLRISAIGYEPYWQQIRLPPDTALGTISLFHSATNLQAVSVTAQRPLYSADGEKTFYHVEDDPSVQSGTASDALQNAPGVEVDAEGNITYRGKTAVEVWINNRPSNMDSEALKQYIKTLPASSIKRIEVLSNPSARYGTSGSIINIVTDGRNPLNQLLSVGFKASTGPRFSPWVSYVYNNDKLSLNLYGSAYFNNFHMKTESHSLMLTDDILLSQTDDYVSIQTQRSQQYVAGGKLDYRFSDRTTVSVWGWFYPSFHHIKSDSDEEKIEYIYNPGDYSFRSDRELQSDYIGGNLGAYLMHKFDTTGRMIEFNWNGGLSSQPYDEMNQRQYNNFPLMGFSRRTDIDRFDTRNSFNVDYTHPYSENGKIETGVTIRYETMDKNVMTDSLAGGVFHRDTVRSYTFKDRAPYVNGYFTVQQKIERLTLKGGLRIESVWLHREHNIPSCNFSKQYLGIVPSIHASYSTKNNHSFTLSYTRRFEIPSTMRLSPFVIYYEDSYTVGNPDLRMRYTHNMEIGWTHYTQWGSIGVEAYYNPSIDAFDQISDVAYSPFFGRVVQMDTTVNIGNSRLDGVILNLTWRPRKFMNIRLYVNGGEVWYRMQVRPGEWVEDQVFGYNVRLNMNAKLWGKVDVFVNGKFNGRQIEFLSRREPNFNVDFGLSTDLFDRHLSLYFKVNDLFQSSNMHTVSTNPYYAEDYRWSYNSRFVSLGLTWRIGKMDLESKGRQGAAY
jgi:outer membrane cobalamin receptor